MWVVTPERSPPTSAAETWPPCQALLGTGCTQGLPLIWYLHRTEARPPPQIPGHIHMGTLYKQTCIYTHHHLPLTSHTTHPTHITHRLIPHPTHSISHSHTTQTSYCTPYSKHITAHHIYLLYTHHTLASCTTYITAHMNTKDQSMGAPGWAGRTESLRAGAG